MADNVNPSCYQSSTADDRIAWSWMSVLRQVIVHNLWFPLISDGKNTMGLSVKPLIWFMLSALIRWISMSIANKAKYRNQDFKLSALMEKRHRREKKMTMGDLLPYMIDKMDRLSQLLYIWDTICSDAICVFSAMNDEQEMQDGQMTHGPQQQEQMTTAAIQGSVGFQCLLKLDSPLFYLCCAAWWACASCYVFISASPSALHEWWVKTAVLAHTITKKSHRDALCLLTDESR